VDLLNLKNSFNPNRHERPMSISALIEKKADELVDLLRGDKQAIDIKSLLSQAGQALQNVELSGDNQQLLRNTAIGTGLGSVAGFTGSSKGHRLGDTLQGAAAGALLGGGGTMAYRAATGGKVPGAPQPNAPAKPRVEAENEGGILQGLYDRKFTAGTAALLGADKAVRFKDEFYGTGSYGNRRFSSPLQSAYMPHVPGQAAPTGVLGKVKELLGSPDTHDNRVGGKIKDNLSSWITQENRPLGDDHKKVLQALNSMGDRDLGKFTKTVADLADDVPLLDAKGNPITYKQHLNENLKVPGSSKKLIAVEDIFSDPKSLDAYLSRRAPASLTNVARWKTPAALGLAALAEPTIAGGVAGLFRGDTSSRKLTPEQIADINARYFGR